MLALVRPTSSSGCTAGPTSRSAHEQAGRHSGRWSPSELAAPTPGRIKLGGEIWSAVPYDEDLTIAARRDRRGVRRSGRHGLRLPVAPSSSPDARSATADREKEGPRWVTARTDPARRCSCCSSSSCWRRRSGSSRRHAPASSSGSASTRRRCRPGSTWSSPFVDQVRYLIDLREQVVSLPAAAGDHRGQPGGLHRHRHLLPGDRPGRRDVRDRQLHPGHRAAHHDHAAQHRRWHGPRADPDQPRGDQPRPARRARRGDRQVGHPRQPRRAQGHRPAAVDQGLDGEADARRPRQARGDPHRRGPAAVRDPHRRGQQAVGDPHGRG